MKRRRPIPRIRGTQLGLKDPAYVDRLKAAMLAGQFAYHELLNRITGLRDRKGTFYVKDGHHRMVAAMEIYREKGNADPVFGLLAWGNWDDATQPPNDRCPLPARDWWRAFLNWLGQ